MIFVNSTNDGGEFETNCCNISPDQLELCKEIADNHDATFLDLDIKIRDGKF